MPPVFFTVFREIKMQKIEISYEYMWLLVGREASVDSIGGNNAGP